MIKRLRYPARLVVLLACLPFVGEAKLAEGNWVPGIRECIDSVIDQYRGNTNAYVVFDFDLTCALSDVEHVVLGWYIDNLAFAFGPDDWESVFVRDFDGSDRQLESGRPELTVRNLVADCSDLHRKLLLMRTGMPMDKVRLTKEFKAFASKCRYLRQTVSDNWPAQVGYPWLKRFYSRKCTTEFRSDVVAALDSASHGSFRRCWLQTPESVPGRAGCVKASYFDGFVVLPEIKDLVRELRQAGIGIYVVSGSFHEIVLVGAGERYGVGVPKDCVFGMRLQKDSCGGIVGNADQAAPLTWAAGKPNVIRKFIAPRHGGSDPVMVVGDSNGDYAMLTEFPKMRVGLVFDTCPGLDTPLGKLQDMARCNGSKRYLIQGRDERVPSLCRQGASILNWIDNGASCH